MSEATQQPPDESGKVVDADSVLDALQEAWVQAVANSPRDDDGPLWVDPDLPVWGNVNMDEVD